MPVTILGDFVRCVPAPGPLRLRLLSGVLPTCPSVTVSSPGPRACDKIRVDSVFCLCRQLDFGEFASCKVGLKRSKHRSWGGGGTLDLADRHHG